MRNAKVNRTTAETDVRLTLELDGTGKADVASGCGFLDHMLTLFAKHGRFDLTLTCKGDTEVDDHHTVEDIGIALGQAFDEALGDRKGITRYGQTFLPMDEALVLTAVDISGRSYFAYEMSLPTEKVGTFDTELGAEFWAAFVRKANLTLHFRQFAGSNSHHILEAAFKSAARTLRAAVAIDPAARDEIPSTKGVLMLAIVDYGVGNLFSLSSSFAAIGAEAAATSDRDAILRADGVILPGVGAFRDAVAKLRSGGLWETVLEVAKRKKPLLGICLGMQLLFERSFEYGEYEGLGLLRGEVRPISEVIPAGYKIPHIGWNPLRICRESPLLCNTREGECVYFVHSYYAAGCDDSVIATAEYGAPLTAAVQSGNVMGCQFHPEKSGKVGLSILRAFCAIAGTEETV